MPITKQDSLSIFGYSNMRGNRVRNIGKPRESTDALPWSLPEYTTAERDALSVTSTTFLIIFNSSTGKINFYDGSAWRAVTST